MRSTIDLLAAVAGSAIRPSTLQFDGLGGTGDRAAARSATWRAMLPTLVQRSARRPVHVVDLAASVPARSMAETTGASIAR